MANISNEEIIKMFSKATSVRVLSIGDHRKDVRAIHNDIFGKVSFLVERSARKYKRFNNYEDLKQEGFIGLLKSIQTFDPNKYENFFKYANQAIRRTMNKSASKFDVVYSEEKTRVVYSDPLDLFIDSPAKDTPETVYIRKEASAGINNALGQFSNRDSEVVERIFGLNEYNPHTLREVSCKLNITHERVRQIKEDIVSKLRKNKELKVYTEE